MQTSVYFSAVLMPLNFDPWFYAVLHGYHQHSSASSNISNSPALGGRAPGLTPVDRQLADSPSRLRP